MKIHVSNITQQQFEAYVDVQIGGAYNMIMNAPQAAEAAGLSLDEYRTIIKNYTELRNQYVV